MLSDEALISQYDSWHANEPQQGCLFARMLASRMQFVRRNWHVVRGNSEQAAAQISEYTHAADHDLGISRLTILLPDHRTSTSFAELFAALAMQPSWRVVRIPSQSVAPEFAALGLRYVLTDLFDGKPIEAEWLGFGDFEPMPPTRRAPVPALEAFLDHTSVQLDPKDPQAAKIRSHLAFLDKPDLSPAKREIMMKRTGVFRLQALGGSDDARAKARVTATVMKEEADAFAI